MAAGFRTTARRLGQRQMELALESIEFETAGFQTWTEKNLLKVPECSPLKKARSLKTKKTTEQDDFSCGSYNMILQFFKNIKNG